MYCDNCENENFDEKFIKAYMGSKADKMYKDVKDGGINLFGILFGVGYFAYRKMYLISIIAIIITNILTYINPQVGSYLGILLGFMFCPLYKLDITRKLRKIKKENGNATEDELLNIAKNKGGTSLIGAIIFFIIYFVLVLCMCLLGGK